MHDSTAPGTDAPGPPPQGAPAPGPHDPGTPGGGGAPEAGRQDGRRGGAARATTIVLTVSLVLVVVLTGVLATFAVLMTRNPDVPLLSSLSVRRLQTPMHLAPVKGTKPAPCPGEEAVLDEAGTTCYQVEAGVTVTTVQKIETLPERNGSYAVRIVLSPESRGPISSLTRETVDRRLALVVGDKVVTAPRVAQAIIQDSLSIAGFTKENADALVARLLGTPAGSAPPTAPATTPSTGTDPGGTNPGGTDPGGTNQDGTNPGGTNPGGTNPGGTDPGGTNQGGAGLGGANPGGLG